MAKKIGELDSDMKKAFSSDGFFNDSAKLEILDKVLRKWLSSEGTVRIEGLDEMIDLFSQINALKPVEIFDPVAFSKEGFRLLQFGIPFSINSGVVTSVKLLTKAFQLEGANVAIVNHWFHKYSFYNKNTDEMENVRMSPYSLLTGDGIFIEMKWALKHILRDLKDRYHYNPQVCHVHTHTFYADESMQVFKSFFPNTPIVYTLHSLIPFIRMSQDDKFRLISDEMNPAEIRKQREKGYHGREIAQEKMIELADRIVTISQVHKNAFDRLYPQFMHKCVCIPHGTDFDMYTEMASVIEGANDLRRQIAPGGEMVIIYVGRVEDQKGAPALAAAINNICRKYHNVKFVFVGATAEAALPVLVKSGMDESVKNKLFFSSWIKDKQTLACYYRLADVMIQPVFSPGLYGFAVLEAMIMKVPVITCPGQLSFGTCETTGKIMYAVDRIFNDRAAVERHVNNIRERVLQDYSLSTMRKRYLEVYASVMK